MSKYLNRTPGDWGVLAKAALVMAPSAAYGSIRVADCRCLTLSPAEQRANAELIAAAPLLLARAERAEAAAADALGFVLYALDHWSWSGWPHLKERTEQLRDVLTAAVAEGGAK